MGAWAALALCAAAGSVRAADLPDVLARGVLRVVVNLDVRRPEFFSVAPGAPKGFDHELLDGFAQLHRVRLDVVPVQGWDALVPALLDGRGDLIAGRFTVTERRRHKIAFTSEVFPYRLVVLTRRPTPVVRSLEELRSHTIGTSRGAYSLEVLIGLGIPRSRLDMDVPTGGYVDALRSGRTTATVWGVESAIASRREDPDLQIGMFLGPPGSLAYGVRKDDPALLEALNTYVENVRRSATWSRLVVKYFGDTAPEILRMAREPDRQ